MRVPTVHLNGTSKDELRRQLFDAADAGSAFLAALAAMSPNGRDYYPQGDNAIREAIAEHRARISRVEAIQAELVAISYEIL